MIQKWAAIVLLGWFFTFSYDITGVPGAKDRSKLGPFRSQASCQILRDSIAELGKDFEGFVISRCVEVIDA